MIWYEPSQEWLNIIPKMMEIDNRRFPLVFKFTSSREILYEIQLHNSSISFIRCAILLKYLINLLVSCQPPRPTSLQLRLIITEEVNFRSFNSIKHVLQFLSSLLSPSFQKFSHSSTDRISTVPRRLYYSWNWAVFVVPLDHQQTWFMCSCIRINE